MPVPEVVIPQMEQTVAGLAGAKQSVADWLAMCRTVMLSGPNRTRTTWQFAYDASVVTATSAILASTCTVYALLIGNIETRGECNFFYMTDIAAGNAVGTETDIDDWFLFQIPAAASATVEEFHPFVFPGGITFAAGLDVLADGNAATASTAGTVRCWVLYAV
jgi:hypothetical protein